MSDDLFEDDQPAVLGYSTKCTTMADGSLRVQIDINPKDTQKAFRMFGSPGSAVALARLQDDVAVEADRPKLNQKGPFGDYARALVLSGFFKTDSMASRNCSEILSSASIARI